MTVRSVWLFAARLAVALVGFAIAGVGFRLIAGPGSRPPFWLVLVATAAVAALLWLVRGPLDRFADRRAFGPDAGGYREIQALLSQMSSTLPVDEVIPALARTLTRRVHSARAEVRVNVDAGGQVREVWPARSPRVGDQLTVPIAHQGDQVGEIDLQADPDAPGGSLDRSVLESIAGPAGLALSTVRLTYSLRLRAMQLADLNAELVRSRERLVGARAEQRRRFRAELEDEVLPELVSAQKVVAVAARANASGAGFRLNPASEALQRALDTLRVLARGVYPPQLADAGLVTALRSWRDGTARLLVSGDPVRLQDVPDVEAVVYFAVTGWLQAAEPGSTGPVRLSVAESAVRFELTGRPAGYDQDEIVQSIRDRVEAFGGGVQVTHRDETMMVSGWLPLVGGTSTERADG